MIERADVPWPRYPGINRREAVQRDQHRRTTFAQPLLDDFGDAAMVGIEYLLVPRLYRVARQAFVAGNQGRFADARDRTWRARRTIAVDHQPRIALRDQMRVEMFRQRLGDAGNADIPGDMPRQLGCRQPEIAERARDLPAVMIRCQQERRAALGIIFMNRRNIFPTKE